MRVFLGGATGVIGEPLTRALVGGGCVVVALSRSESSDARIRALGGEPARGDAFDPDGLRDAVVAAKPEVVIHQMTALPKRLHPRKIRRQAALTNRLRTEGARNLVAAAQAAGARRLVTQSIAFIYAPGAAAPPDEDAPVHTASAAPIREFVTATVTGERVALTAAGLEGVALRYGFFYGPGTAFGEGGAVRADVQRRRVPLVGQARGVWSFVHVDDCVSATLLALGHTPPGVYNIVDDDPAPASAWIPEFAEALGAKAPRRVPRFLGRLGAGPYGAYIMDACPYDGFSATNVRSSFPGVGARQ